MRCFSLSYGKAQFFYEKQLTASKNIKLKKAKDFF